MQEEGRGRREVVLSCLKLPGILSRLPAQDWSHRESERGRSSRSQRELNLVSTEKSLVWALGKLREATGLYSSVYTMGLILGGLQGCDR